MTATDEQVRAWASVLRVHAAVVPRLERELAAVGMPLSWYDVLLELNSAPDRRLRMTELGARAVLSRERVSRVVDELERAGLVRRERNPDDGRSLLAVITDEGRARLRAAAPTYLAGIERHFGAHLDAEEARAVATALFRVVEAAEQQAYRPHRPHPPLTGMRPGLARVGTFACASRHLCRRGYEAGAAHPRRHSCGVPGLVPSERVGTFDSARGRRRGLRHEVGPDDGPPTTRHTEPVQHAVGRG